MSMFADAHMSSLGYLCSCAGSDYHNSSEVLGTSQQNNFIMADIEESLGIGESLSVNNDQINDIIAS